MQGQGLCKRQNATQEEENDGLAVGQKRRLETLVEEALADQQQMCERARAVHSRLKRLREEQKSIAESLSLGSLLWRFLSAGAHASFAALRDRGCLRAELHCERA